jgi:thiol:disulfide interchange protein DsbC
MLSVQRSFQRSVSMFCAALLACGSVFAQEAVIRKNLSERLPNLPKIDEVSKTAIPGVYEVRIGAEVLYSDEQGNHLIQGQLIDTKTRTNITEARLAKLSAINFASLPLKDAVVIKQGSGARKMAVFVDPNCGYCKKFERDLVDVKDVTIYTFLYPILGPNSTAKSRDIWCAKDAGKAWRAWMVDGVAPAKSIGNCDVAALDRNIEFGKAHRVQGTPAVFFEDGTRVPGAIPLEEVERGLVAATKKG